MAHSPYAFPPPGRRSQGRLMNLVWPDPSSAQFPSTALLLFHDLADPAAHIGAHRPANKRLHLCDTKSHHAADEARLVFIELTTGDGPCLLDARTHKPGRVRVLSSRLATDRLDGHATPPRGVFVPLLSGPCVDV